MDLMAALQSLYKIAPIATIVLVVAAVGYFAYRYAHKEGMKDRGDK